MTHRFYCHFSTFLDHSFVKTTRIFLYIDSLTLPRPQIGIVQLPLPAMHEHFEAQR